ncbi:MAG: hypothetical protein IPM46_01445 [Flavobacteriales bacterium]|nr:hypothetical protein [Flavobacteriales bacterium]
MDHHAQLPWTNTTLGFTQSGGTWSLSASNPVVFATGTNFTWTGGTINGPADVTLQSGATGTWSTGGKVLNTALTNNGTVTWSGGQISGSGTVNNTATGILDITFTGGSPAAGFPEQRWHAQLHRGGCLVHQFCSADDQLGHLEHHRWELGHGQRAHQHGHDQYRRHAIAHPQQHHEPERGHGAHGHRYDGGQWWHHTHNFPWTNTTLGFTQSGGTWSLSASNPVVFATGTNFTWTGGTIEGWRM